MAAGDVPPLEMHPFRAAPDPIDAALRGEPVDDPAIAALVHDLRRAYLPDGARRRSSALVAFAGPGSDGGDPALAPTSSSGLPPEPVPSLGRRVRVAVAAFAATLAGKVVLGGAVAAAAVGGLHAADVVEVPLLPDVDRRPPVTDPTPGELELPPLDAEGSDADVAPNSTTGGQSRPTLPTQSGTTRPGDGGAPEVPDAGADPRSEGRDDPETTPPPTAAPSSPVPPVSSSRPPSPGSGTPAGPPTTTGADASPPTSATQPQASRNIS